MNDSYIFGLFNYSHDTLNIQAGSQLLTTTARLKVSGLNLKMKKYKHDFETAQNLRQGIMKKAAAKFSKTIKNYQRIYK